MKSHKEQILNKCRHFTGISNKICKAGVAYDDVKPAGRFGCLPCFKDSVAPMTCDKCSFFTEEEAEARVAASKKEFDETEVARKAIVEHLGPHKKGVGGQGVIDCPICGGKETLRFSRAGYNGHILAVCSTPECVCWME